MKISKQFNFNKSKSKKGFKIILSSVILLALCCGVFYEAYEYNRLLTDFKTNFEDFNFSKANNLLLTKQEFNPFKGFMLKHDVSKYLNTKINNLNEQIENGSITSESALIQLKEIDHYDLVSVNIESAIKSIDLIADSNNKYNAGVNYFNNGQYTEAISTLKDVSALDLNYADSLKYLNESKSKLKESVLTHCDELVENDYYTQALSTLSDSSNLIGDDVDIKKKILEVKVHQQEYFDKNSEIAEASSSALITNICPSNINQLNVESTTSYLVNVNIKEQKTYVYKGKADKWNLVKTFPCSTGISGEDTPSGSFDVKEKGAWFFSEKYKQGGKYWTQITGNILFHSLPFSKDKTTVVDYTLNKPSSHGCIRLSINDSKWIYTNIPKGSKVIIK